MAKAKAKTKSGSKSKPVAKKKPVTKAKPVKTKPKAKVQPKAKVKAKAKPDAKAKTKAPAKAKSKPVAKAKVVAKTKEKAKKAATKPVKKVAPVAKKAVAKAKPEVKVVEKKKSVEQKAAPAKETLKTISIPKVAKGKTPVTPVREKAASIDMDDEDGGSVQPTRIQPKKTVPEIAMVRIRTKPESAIEEKLNALFDLQQIDSSIDRIKSVRGELPLEVCDLEDEITGLQMRLDKMKEEGAELDKAIADRKNIIKDAKASIKKYEEQQKNVRNNREFDSISKEIEFQGLEIELSEKKIKEFAAKIEHKSDVLTGTSSKLDERKNDLEIKQGELKEILAETDKDENKLIKESNKAKTSIEDRLLGAYQRLRENSRNGLAVVSVVRDACGGCFNQIPPQRQLDIQARKKLIICEHCGRMLVEPPGKLVPADQAK